ncbi:cytochrome c3 family protein [Geobacter sp. FeAm09]|uniref:cytochrome c3 family protein n=1 Tax=Geobacter sp. FeAm09 TaxID=2597769 RepID=UPI0011ED2CBA|nr:cytochrome c3 family protein [Geobacter sp. FeAm09]QEM66777.1 cytochrome c3 family protein [Geobacter sp. FeAm09]
MKLFRAILAALAVATMALPSRSGADSIVNSPHNLSSGSTARVMSTEETRVCIFCHTPHHATKLSDTSYTGPLWSREENTAQDYTPYASTTIAASPGQPQGPSRLCLSCHDGTIALGAPGTHATSATLGPLTPPPTGKSTVLGKDLRDDHPISMEYGRKTSEFRDAATVTGTTRIKLVRRASTLYVECTSCHDPHDNQYGNFLVLDTSSHRDALCTVCHAKTDWTGSAHENGGTRSSGSIPADVAKNGCVNCHTPTGPSRGSIC